MKEEYILFLDESEFTKSALFSIAGFAIKKSYIPKLEKDVNDIKEIIWTEEFIKENNPTLHCTEFQSVYNHRAKKPKYSINKGYNEFAKKTKEEISKNYEQVYGRLAKTLKDCEVTTFGCIINTKQVKDLFYIDEKHDGSYLIDDKFSIALQNIVECYTHYLSSVDGYGDVIYEARNSSGENSSKSPDIRLINDYHKIQANNKGIVYTDSSAIQCRNRTITITNKGTNLAGLQIADFIVYNMLLLEIAKYPSQKTDFMKLIDRLSYNGGYDLKEKDQRAFWGIRVLPAYLKMSKMSEEKKSLKNAYKNLKKEKNKIKKLLNQAKCRIDELEKEKEIQNI